MPGYSYSLPASMCPVGSKLRLIPHSTCSKCYAFRGHYNYNNVKNSLAKRLESLNDLPKWISCMSWLINHTGTTHFRWHDSGDIQSTAHLEAIIAVCDNTKQVSHWLPTREYHVVTKWLKSHTTPANLIIRLSAPMLMKPPPNLNGCHTSTVGASIGYACPAHDQNDECQSCRACWDKDIPNVDYRPH